MLRHDSTTLLQLCQVSATWYAFCADPLCFFCTLSVLIHCTFSVLFPTCFLRHRMTRRRRNDAAAAGAVLHRFCLYVFCFAHLPESRLNPDFSLITVSLIMLLLLLRSPVCQAVQTYSSCSSQHPAD